MDKIVTVKKTGKEDRRFGLDKSEALHTKYITKIEAKADYYTDRKAQRKLKKELKLLTK